MPVTKTGRRFFYGPPGSVLPPAGTPERFVVGLPTESVATIEARMRAGTAETYPASLVSNVRDHVPNLGGSVGGTVTNAVNPATLVSTAPPELEMLGYNLVLDGATGKTQGNLVWKSTVPYQWQLTRNGAVIAGLDTPMPGEFQDKYTGDNFVPGANLGYTARGRIDALTVGGGVQPGTPYTLRMRNPATPTVAFEIVLTPQLSGPVVAITLPRAPVVTGSGGGGSSYAGGSNDPVTGLTDPDGQAADTDTVPPLSEA